MPSARVHQHMAATEALQHARLNTDQVGWNTPITWLSAPAGLVSAEHIENRAYPSSRAPARRTSSHRESWREHEADADFVYTLPDLFRVRLRLTPSFSSTSAEPQVEKRAPAMLGHMRPCCRSDQRAGVEMLKVCAASPRSRRCRPSGCGLRRVPWRRTRASRMRLRKFPLWFSFFTRRPTRIPAICAAYFAAHDLAHQRQHLIVKNSRWSIRRTRLVAVSSWLSLPFQKILQQSCPCSVRMDSGWNCTPCTASVLCARHDLAVVGPCGDLQAVRRVSRSITSEW